MKLLSAAIAASLSLQYVAAVVSEWGQCGGINYSGDTTCVSGCTCVQLNPYYYQCLVVTTTTSSSSTVKTTSSTKATSSSKTSSSSVKTTSSTKTSSSTKATSSTKSTSSSSTKPTSTSTSTSTKPTSTSSSTKATSTSTSTTSTSSTTTSTSTSASASATFAPLNDIAVAAGKQYFGVAVDTDELANATYAVNLDNTDLFGQITPGNKMKWDATEPTQGVFTFDAADAIVEWALADGKQVRGHCLIWYNQLPSWLTSGTFTNDTLVAIVQEHITTLVSHYKGQVKTWDVLNEIFNDDGTWRTTLWYNTIGPYHADIALRAAEAADPDVGLAANDYNLDYGGAKVTAYVNLVTDLKSRGVKITQIGSQSHLIVGSTPGASSLAAIYSQLIATDVDVAITELDIRMTLPVTDALLAQQKIDYNNVIRGCMMVSRCIGMTIWAYSDFYSWVPSTFAGQGAALPWDDALNAKPAFYGILDALDGIADS